MSADNVSRLLERWRRIWNINYGLWDTSRVYERHLSVRVVVYRDCCPPTKIPINGAKRKIVTSWRKMDDRRAYCERNKKSNPSE